MLLKLPYYIYVRQQAEILCLESRINRGFLLWVERQEFSVEFENAFVDCNFYSGFNIITVLRFLQQAILKEKQFLCVIMSFLLIRRAIFRANY